MTIYHKATFSDGEVITRAATSKRYVACIRVRWIAPPSKAWGRPEPYPQQLETWASRPDLVDQQVNYAQRQGRNAEQAPAVEITASEYRELKGSARLARTRRAEP